MGKIELRIGIDPDLLLKARAAGVDVEDAAEAGVRRALAEAGAAERARQWSEENAAAIRLHNQRIAERGLFGEDLRRW